MRVYDIYRQNYFSEESPDKRKLRGRSNSLDKFFDSLGNKKEIRLSQRAFQEEL